jgi:uncharacterized repeat protein (TIGR01451 family)
MKNYFKKFSIIFAMSLFIILGSCVSAFADDNYEIGTSNLNGTTSVTDNSAVIGNVLKHPEVGWKRYDDTNSNISYVGNGWAEYRASTEYANGTAYTEQPNNSSVKFNFTGTKIRIINPYNPRQNTSVDVYIDGVKVNSHSLYREGNFREVLVYECIGLENKEHYFEYKFTGKNVAAFDAVDIDINEKIKPYNENIISMSLNKTSTNLIIDNSEALIATTTPSGISVKWSSSDNSIATVDQSGKVTAISEGTATITATTIDGSNLSASCVVTVTPKGTDPQPTDTDKIVNIAHAKGDNTNNPAGEVTIIFHGTADTALSVLKTADVKDVWVGDNFTYTIVVTNTGTKTARAVIVNDTAPNHIDFNVSGITTTQGSVDSSSTSKNIKINVGDIPPAGTVTIKVPVTVIF